MDSSVEEKVSFLPAEDTEYLENKGYNYEQIVDGKTNGLIIHDYLLPDGKYHMTVTDILIRIPNGYNDTFPDMFFCYPHLKLNTTASEPVATNGRVNFNGITWQQWSRHSNIGNDWRPGIDGIKSHLRKVNNALERG